MEDSNKYQKGDRVEYIGDCGLKSSASAAVGQDTDINQGTQTTEYVGHDARAQDQRTPSVQKSSTDQKIPLVGTSIYAATDQWSHVATQGDASSGAESASTITRSNQASEHYQYQLQHWIYETSDENLTFTERMEKKKWE